MGIAAGLGAGTIILLLHTIPADFKIEATPPLPAATQAPVPLATPTSSAPLPSSPAARPAADWRPPVALGFGHDVPLAFAVRQIAPRWVQVSYGDNVDSRVSVSWRGGRPWNQVLGGILAPLGLHMKLEGRTLWIRS